MTIQNRVYESMIKGKTVNETALPAGGGRPAGSAPPAPPRSGGQGGGAENNPWRFLPHAGKKGAYTLWIGDNPPGNPTPWGSPPPPPPPPVGGTPGLQWDDSLRLQKWIEDQIIQYIRDLEVPEIPTQPVPNPLLHGPWWEDPSKRKLRRLEPTWV